MEIIDNACAAFATHQSLKEGQAVAQAFDRRGLICMGSAMASLLFEFSLLKVMGRLTGEALVWEALTLGLYLAAFGGGVLYTAARPLTYAWQRLWRLELGLMFTGCLSVPGLLVLHMLYRIYLRDWGIVAYAGWWQNPLHAFALAAQGVTCLLGFLAGQEMAVLFAVLRREEQVSIARFHVLYYLGALLATLVFVFALAPHFTPSMMVFIAALLNALIALAVYKELAQGYRRGLLGGLCVGLFFVGVHQGLPQLERMQRSNTYYNNLAWSIDQTEVTWLGPVSLKRWWHDFRTRPAIETHRSPYQEIDVVPAELDPHYPQRTGEWALYLNGHYQFDTRLQRDYHEHMAHVPSMAFRTIPPDVLVLGGGDGLLVHELLKYGERLNSVSLVELDPLMLELAQKPPLSDLNQSALSHRKVRVINQDAFLWLRHQRQTFAAIYVDLPYPFSLDTQRLFSREFFELLRYRLRSGGFVVFDFPFELQAMGRARSREVMAATLAAAGFSHIAGFSARYDTFIAASIQRTAPQFSFVDYQLSLSSLRPAWFDNPQHWAMIPAKAQPAAIHSLIQPQMLGYSDRAF